MKYLRFLLAVLTILLFSGCQTIDTYPGAVAAGMQQYQVVADGGWLTVFLNLKQAAGPDLIATVTAVEIRSGSSWHRLNHAALSLDSKKIGAGQMFVARKSLVQGNYDALRFVFGKVSMKKGGGLQPLTLAETTVEIDLPRSLSLRKSDSQSLFVTWDVLASLASQNTFAAALTAGLQAIPLVVDLAFVACPEVDTVYVVRTDRNWVISSISLPGRPTYLDVDPLLNRLYVLAAEESAIMIFDLNTNKLSDKIFVPMDNRPSFMLVGPDKRYAYVLDELGKSMTRVDILSGVVEERANFSFRPNYAATLPDQGNVAVSASDTNTAYLLHPETLQTDAAITVGSNPQGLLATQGLLFVAESDANTISSYNLDDGGQRNRVNVGFAPTRLLVKNNQLYVANFMSGTITVSLPEQLDVLQDIFVGGRPQELAGADNRPWIYVSNAESGGLTVINATSNRVAGFIDLATATLGLALIE